MGADWSVRKREVCYLEARYAMPCHAMRCHAMRCYAATLAAGHASTALKRDRSIDSRLVQEEHRKAKHSEALGDRSRQRQAVLCEAKPVLCYAMLCCAKLSLCYALPVAEERADELHRVGRVLARRAQRRDLPGEEGKA